MMTKTIKQTLFISIFFFSTISIFAQSIFEIYPTQDMFSPIIQLEENNNGFFMDIQEFSTLEGPFDYKYFEIGADGNLNNEVNFDVPAPDDVRPLTFRLSDETFISTWTDGDDFNFIPGEKFAYLRQIDNAGNILQNLEIPLPETIALATNPILTELPDGTIFIFNNYNQIDMGGGPDLRFFIYTHYDLETETILSQNEFQFGTNFSSISSTSINTASDGNVFLKFWDATGSNQHFIRKIQPDGTELWSTMVSSLERPVSNVTPTDDGGVWYHIRQFGTISKLESDGEFGTGLSIFDFQSNVNNGITVGTFAPTPDGGIILIGPTSGQIPGEEFIVAKISGNGEILSDNRYAFPGTTDPEFTFTQGIRKQDGTFAFSGSFGGFGDMKTPFLITVNENGEFIIPSGGGADLSLSISGTTETPSIWSTHSITLTVSNTGGDNASGIEINIPEAAGDVYQGGNEFTASQGTFQPYGNQTWDVGSLSAGGSASITINYFKNSNVDFFQYAEVSAMNESDADSTPGNGNGTSANEDDEATFPGSGPGDPCNPDATNPVFSNCPSNIELTTSGNSAQAFWTAPTATDNCSTASVNSNYNSGNTFSLGTTTVNYTATDNAGNSASCSFTVTVSNEPIGGSCDNNILVDPGFENGFSNNSWRNVDGGAEISNDAYSGSKAMKIASQADNRIIQGLSATAGETYTLSAYGKLSSNSGDGVIYIKFLSASWQPIETTTTGINSTSYEQYTLTAPAPANTAYIEVGLRKSPGNFALFADEWCLDTGGGNNGDPKADLQLENLSAPSSTQASSLINYTFTLKNTGDAAASGNFNIRAYFSTDSNLSSNDIFDGLVPTGNVGAGQTINNVNGASNVPNLADGNYYLILKVDADDDIDESNENNNTIVRPITIGQPSNPGTYCDVESDFPWHEWISNVQIDNQLDFASGKLAYSDFTNTAPTITLEQDQTFNYVVDVTYSYATYGAYVSVYTDFNRNGIFEESEKSNVSNGAISPGPGVVATIAGTEVVPENAQLGETRMRVIVSRNPIVDACTNIAFGEVEDYKVNIVPSANINTRMAQISSNEVLAYPNPVGEELTVEISENLPAQQIRIFNAMGTIQKEIIIDPRQNFENFERITIPTAELKNGVYFLQVSGESFKPRVIRIMVQRTY